MNWPTPPTEWFLAEREVHVWSATLDRTTDELTHFSSLLSDDERTRANRFHFERDQNRFTVGRGLLRTVLSRYVQKPAHELKFTYSDRGKPTLGGLPVNETLHFNLSHSRDFALLAVTRVCPIGVDVEWIRPLSDAEAIAERFFSARESTALKALPVGQKPIGFFNLWTRKEAWLKATGEGISNSLNQVEVSLLPEEPAQLLSLFGDTRIAADWTLLDLKPAPNVKGALAAHAPNLQVKTWSWPFQLLQ
ncbi:MAG: phosphopantetheine-protein transferase [Pedosphaera sp.]|nr:phosphopantetheine-protein transferase [Pedosphaera sp.]